MTVIAFNTLAYFEELKAAGVPEQQAKVQAETLNKILDENLATKKDILLLQHVMASVEERLTYKFKDLENKLMIRLGGMIIGSFMATVTTLGFLMSWTLKGVH